MELTLEIISFQKSLMGDAQSQTFDETGGSIGRARENAWVLPDPNRYVSSRHAEISFSAGRFRITDVSTNGVFVNGSATAIGRDQHAVLSDGDRLVLGDYEIAVRQTSSSRREELPRLDSVTPAPFERTGEAPKDILDVIDRRRTEPRLGRLELPADVFDSPAVPPPTVPPPVIRPAPPAPAAAQQPPAPRGPIPPPPPRRQPPAVRAEPTVAPKAAAIPDDVDFGPIEGTPPPPVASTPARAPAPPPVALPDDLDAFLPDPPATRTAPTQPPGISATRPPVSESDGARPPLLPDDDLDDLLPVSVPRPEPKPPAQRLSEPPEQLLPEGVPLLRPMPGTGNRPQPLAASAATDPVPPKPAIAPIRNNSPAAAADTGASDMVSALAAGLGVDPRSLEGLDGAATVALVGRAARSAALGIAGALDARNALARTAGLDPSAFDQDDENPFLVFRSGEAALKQSLAATTPSQSLDAATRQSVATLEANASAAAVALGALLDRFDSNTPPQSADEVREIFGTSFLNAYHREISRLS